MVFGLLWYCFYGAPQFSAEARFRRAEKAELIGPSQILGAIEEGYNVYLQSFGKVVLAEDENHVIAYGGWSKDLWRMCYRPKMGKVTVLGLVQASDDTGQKMTGVVAYDDCPEAVRAELDLTVRTNYDNSAFEKTYSLRAQREEEGYFLFKIICEAGTSNQETVALSNFCEMSWSTDRFDRIDEPADAVVRLYDEQDTLIFEDTLVIRHRNAAYMQE